MTVLVLGTAQWGAGYGITNAVGRLDDGALAGIMALAEQVGIAAVDTAAGYGDAQERLRPWASGLQVTTKVAGAEPERVQELVTAAAAALGRDSVDSLLLHDWEKLDKNTQESAAAALNRVKALGLAARVGTSVYDELGVRTSVGAFSRLDCLQVPANALDRRLDSSATLSDLRRLGTRIQVRSVFLQGLLAADSTTKLGQHPAVRAFHSAAANAGLSPAAFALAHVKALPWADEIVVGVTSAAELEALFEAWENVEPALAPPDLACFDLSVIDPRRWAA